MNHGVTNLKIFLARLPSLKNKKVIMTLVFAGIIAFAGCTKKPLVVKPDPIVETVPNLDNFIKEPVGVITIEATGEKVDLAKLKAQYGNLYRLVEPMTDKEIDDQYRATITVCRQSFLSSIKRRKNNEQEINIFGYLYPKTEAEMVKYAEAITLIYDDIIKAAATSNDAIISSKFSFYFRPIGNGFYDFIYTDEMLKSVKTGEVGTTSKGDKEAFVRYYKIGLDVEKQVRSVQKNLDPVNQFKDGVPIIKEPETVSKTK